MNTTKNNFFIITGGPGAGKSSVLNELETSGYDTVPEVGRKIIQEQLAIGGSATHSKDRIAFRDLMLEYSIDDYKKSINNDNIIFFDRGIPELSGYSKLISEPCTDAIISAINQYRYNSNVFIFPPWKEIYVNDEERKQDFQEAITTYQYIKEAYIHTGYTLIEVPKFSIASRTEFILSYIKNLVGI